jgi:hypothetical protein
VTIPLLERDWRLVFLWFILLGTMYVRYLMALWEIASMSVLILGWGISKSQGGQWKVGR